MLKKLLLFVFVFVVASAGPAWSADDDVAKATTAATSWLALTDAGKYGQGWAAAAAFLRGAVTKAAFIRQLQGARTPFGLALSRKVLSATPTHNLPGAPDGDYVVIQFETAFKNKAHAIETITPMKETDGAWRVSGYFIK
jgi:hypothetical protein